MSKAEEVLHDVVDSIVPVVEAAGVLVVVAGTLVAFARLLYVLPRDRGTSGFSAVRLDFARFLALGLEFQLASDILKTAITPTFEQIGHLAAIAALRTVLNFFLDREIGDQKEQAEEDDRENGRQGRKRGLAR